MIFAYHFDGGLTVGVFTLLVRSFSVSVGEANFHMQCGQPGVIIKTSQRLHRKTHQCCLHCELLKEQMDRCIRMS